MALSVTCPFCGLPFEDPYLVSLHVEERHTDDSPFVPRDNSSNGPWMGYPAADPGGTFQQAAQQNGQWVKCPKPDCNEYLLLSDMNEHLDLHTAEALREEETGQTLVHQHDPPGPYDHPVGFDSYRPIEPPQEFRSLSSPQDSRQHDWARRSSRSQSLPQSRGDERNLPSSQNDDRREYRIQPQPRYEVRREYHRPPSPQYEVRRPRRPREQGQRRRSSPSPRRSTREVEHRSSVGSDVRSIGSSVMSWFSGTSSLSSTTSRPVTPRRKPVRKIPPPLKPGRLGIRELGPHAFEERMPREVRESLLYDAQPCTVQRIGSDGKLYRERTVANETPKLIDLLADLHADDPTTKATYLCHPGVCHIHKLPCEGNFCGYWNIQVLMTYLRHVEPERHGRVPNVLDIQEHIEEAWRRGICPYGKVETGGVYNTRKWIGTHEALAFFTQIGVQVEALSFKDGDDPGSDKTAVDDLLDHVEAYFMSGLDVAKKYGTSYITRLPPVYFQRFGHSMTIVGLERKMDGSRNLLIFDSSFATSRVMNRLLDRRSARFSLSELLRPYRRSDQYLTRWKEFEVIALRTAVAPPPPVSPEELPPELPPRRYEQWRA